MIKRGVFEKELASECHAKQGKPLSMRWIDTVKADGRYRSRLVVREIKKAKKPGDKLEPQDVFSSSTG